MPRPLDVAQTNRFRKPERPEKIRIMTSVNSQSQTRLTGADHKLTLIETEDGEVYGRCDSRAGNDLAAVCLLREAGTGAVESLPPLPRGSSRSASFLPGRQGRPPGSAPWADVHAAGRSDLLFRRRPQYLRPSYQAQSVGERLFGSARVSRGPENVPLWAVPADSFFSRAQSSRNPRLARLQFTSVATRRIIGFSAKPNK